MSEEYPITSESGQRMISNLPEFYETFREFRYISQTEGNELDDLQLALEETLNQYFASVATWGLDNWENELGLTPAPSQPDSERRDRIVSRLRGTGTATIRVVKNVAESYDGGGIDVVEDHAAYTVSIVFVDTRGVPPNIEDLKAAVRAVVPAHLSLIYEFRYTLFQDLNGVFTYGELNLSGLTYGDLKTKLPT